jgi:hypothetical protein
MNGTSPFREVLRLIVVLPLGWAFLQQSKRIENGGIDD